MEKFIVLQRDFSSAKPEEQFTLHSVEAKDSEKAWEIVEEEIATNNSQDWIMTNAEFEALKELLKKGV